MKNYRNIFLLVSILGFSTSSYSSVQSHEVLKRRGPLTETEIQSFLAFYAYYTTHREQVLRAFVASQARARLRMNVSLVPSLPTTVNTTPITVTPAPKRIPTTQVPIKRTEIARPQVKQQTRAPQPITVPTQPQPAPKKSDSKTIGWKLSAAEGINSAIGLSIGQAAVGTVFWVFKKLGGGQVSPLTAVPGHLKEISLQAATIGVLTLFATRYKHYLTKIVSEKLLKAVTGTTAIMLPGLNKTNCAERLLMSGANIALPYLLEIQEPMKEYVSEMAKDTEENK